MSILSQNVNKNNKNKKIKLIKNGQIKTKVVISFSVRIKLYTV